MLDSITVAEMRTRFLFRFRFDETKLDVAPEVLRGLQYKTPVRTERDAGESVPVWINEKPLRRYFDEYIPQVRHGHLRDPQCYWRVPDETAKAWFGNYLRAVDHIPTEVIVESDIRWLALDLRTGVELFLFESGCGVLSITLSTRKGEGMPLAAVKNINYRLSQYHFEKSGFLGFAPTPHHPSPPLPRKGDGLLPERLGRPGGWFRLIELAEYLLTPLADRPELACSPIQPEQQFMVYTVVRLPEQWAVSTVQRPAGLGPEVDLVAHTVALAQIEESSHALVPAGDLGVPVAILSTNHVAVVVSQGSAHLIVDQGIEFDRQRTGQVIEKYFTAFLIALSQRLTLQTLSERAFALNPFNRNTAPEEFERLRERTFRFSSSNSFVEVSARDAFNRYYDVARTGQRVPEQLRLVHQSIADLGEALDSRRHNLSLETMVESQSRLEWIEIFLISIYASELTHILGEVFRFDPAFAAWGVVAAMVLAPMISIVVLFGRGDHSRKLLIATGLVLVLVTLYLGWGYRTHAAQSAELKHLRDRIDRQVLGLAERPEAGHPRIATLTQLASTFVAQASSLESSHDMETARQSFAKAAELYESAGKFTDQAQEAVVERSEFLRVCDASCLRKPEIETSSRRADLAWATGNFPESAELWKAAASQGNRGRRQ